MNYLALILCVEKTVICWKPIGKQSKSDDVFVQLEQIDSDLDYINDNTDVNSQLENIGISPTLVLIAAFRAGLAGLNLGYPEKPALKPRKPS